MNMIQCKCEGCGIDFSKSKSEVNRSKTGIHYCANICQVSSLKNKNEIKYIEKQNAYRNNPNLCKYCGDSMAYNKKDNKFCSTACAATFNQQDGGHRHWTDNEKKMQSILSKTNPWFNGEKKLKPVLCKGCGNKFQPVTSRRKFCSHKCSNTKRDLSRNGGFREKGGRGKQGWYKGVYCQSSWELAWVIYALDHDIKFKRNTEGFEYEFETQKHKYYPDFIVGDKSYVEVKGYNSKQWTAKHEQFKHNLEIIDRKKIKPYLDYAIQKYGKDFIKVYE